MKAFREERKTMHTKRAVHWVSSVAVLAATALGLSAPLAAPASAAGAETITAVAEQPRYPTLAAAVFDVTVANPNVGDQLSATIVSGPDQPSPSTSCTQIAANGSGTCTVHNNGIAGTDRITVSDVSAGAVSAQAPVSFETITATADQNVGTVNSPLYLYGANESAIINVTVNGASTTPALKALVTSGPDTGTSAQCTQSASQPGNWTCSLTNGGKGGADVVSVFDDDNPSGTTGQADVNEAKAQLTINYELLTAVPASPRAQTQAAGTGKINVTLTGKPAGWAPQIKELVKSAQFSSAGSCTDNNAGQPSDPQTSWTCTVTNSGRPDTATVQVFDDLDGNNSPGSEEPSATAILNFEQLSATDTNGPGHSAGSTATISVTASGVPQGQSPSIDYQVTSGPDAGGVVVCPQTGTTWTCSLTNNGTTTGAPDVVRVFDDANNNGVYDGGAGEPFVMINVTFGDHVAATPKSVEVPTSDANNPGSGVATFDVVSTAGSNATEQVRWTVTSGPDKDATPGPTAASPNAAFSPHTSQPCAPQGGGTTDWVCHIQNAGSAGLDTIVIYDDTNCTTQGCQGESNFAALYVPATDPASDTVKAQFDVPTSISLTPQLAPGQTQNQVAVGGCQVYVITVNPTVQFPVAAVATKDLGKAPSTPTPPAQVSTCNVPGGSIVSVTNSETASGGGIIAGNPDWTQTLTVSGLTNQDPAHPGQLIFGLTSNAAGAVTVFAKTTLKNNNLPQTANQTMNVVTTSQTSARTLTATPSSSTITQGATQAFSVLVQDANGTPIPGAQVQYVVGAGSPDATAKAVTCINADQFGKASCSLTNNRNVGVDNVVFFAPQASGETAPAANDPQTTAKVTVQALPPAGSTLTFGCPDELISDANQIVPACTVSTTNGNSRQVIFAAHVADANNAPLAGMPVSFTMTASPNGSTATASQVTTNAKGNALFVVTVPSPAAGDKITVTAQVGDPANGGLGPDTATATFQAPHPAVVSVTPHSQQVAAGGLVSVTARVTDQFGVGVGGQSLSWAVSGRNSQSGNATTGSNGTVSFSYADGGGSGSDTITVLDVSPNAPSGSGSNNPATAFATFGSGGGGCTSNCGGPVEKPTLTVSQRNIGHREAKLTLVVTSRPKLVNAKVIFYQLSRSGVRHRIGTGTTGPRGKVTGTLKAAIGLHLRFQAKVVGKAGVRSGFSNVARIHVT